MSKITLKSVDLHRVLSDALLFAESSGTIPAIGGVRLETTSAGDGVNLLAVATDRFTLGVSRADASGDMLADGLTIAGDDVKNVIRIAKTIKRDESWREVTVDTGDADNVRTVTFTFTSGEAITVHVVDAAFPAYRQLFPTFDAAQALPAGAGIGVTSVYLAKFGKLAASHGRTMSIHPYLKAGGGIGPVVVTVGDDFHGLIMPVRCGDGNAHRDNGNVFDVPTNPVWF